MATVTPINANTFELQNYSSQDKNLLVPSEINTTLTGSSSIEFHIYSPNNELLDSVLNYENYGTTPSPDSTGPDHLSSITLTPEKDLELKGYKEGEYIAFYSFLNEEIGNPFQILYIEEGPNMAKYKDENNICIRTI